MECVALLNLYLRKAYFCAKACFESKLFYFNLTPKFHYIAHVSVDLQVQLSLSGDNDVVLNPALFATQAEIGLGSLAT